MFPSRRPGAGLLWLAAGARRTLTPLVLLDRRSNELCSVGLQRWHRLRRASTKRLSDPRPSARKEGDNIYRDAGKDLPSVVVCNQLVGRSEQRVAQTLAVDVTDRSGGTVRDLRAIAEARRLVITSLVQLSVIMGV